MTVRVVEGQTSPVQGWVALGYGVKVPSPTVIFEAPGTLPASIGYALVPSAPGSTPAEAKSIRVNTPADSHFDPVCVRVGNTEAMIDLLGSGREKKWLDVATDARLVLLEREGDRLNRVSVVGGSRIMFGDQFRLDLRQNPTTGTTEISYTPQHVTVSCAEGARLKIPLLGRKAIVVNGTRHDLRRPAQNWVLVEGEAVRTE